LSANGVGHWTLDFGRVTVGRTYDVALVLPNNGTAPLTLVDVGASSDSEFGLNLLSGTVIQPADEVAFLVGFDPISTGAKAASVTITTDSADTPVATLTLSGIGVP
jgi:hypothetical protein